MSFGELQFLALAALWASLAGFWVWMLVDCLIYMPKGSFEKLTWSVVIVFASFIGALIYCLVQRRARFA